MSSSTMNESPMVVVLDTNAMDKDTKGDDEQEVTEPGQSTLADDNKDDELQRRFILPSPLTSKAISFSDESERKSIDEEDYPSMMLMDASSDDESVQELLERANANKCGSQTKLLLVSSTPSSASSIVIPDIDDDDDDDAVLDETIRGKERNLEQNDEMQSTNPKRNLWPTIVNEEKLGHAPVVDPNDSDGKSQVSHTFVGDVVDQFSNANDAPLHHLQGELPSNYKENESTAVSGDENEKIALAERLAQEAQSAVTWLDANKVDAKGLSASSGGEEEDDEVINNCLDSLQQLEMQQDEESVNVAEQNARALQQVLERLQQGQQQQQQFEDGTDDDQRDLMIVVSDDDDDDEREVGQYFTVLDALNPPSTEKVTSVEQNPPEPEQFKARDVVQEKSLQQQQLKNVEDPTMSVTEADDFESEHPTQSVLLKLPIESPTKHRRVWMCIGLMAVVALAAIAVGVAIGLTSKNNNHSSAAAGSNIKSVSKVSPTTPAPTISASDAPAASLSPSTYGTGIRINAGSSIGYTDTKGRYWQPDNGFIKGTAYQVPSSQRQQLVSNTQDQALFLSQRYGSQFEYSFPLYSYAVYRVDLHFAEIYDGALAIGRRVMDVEMERVPVLRKFDIFKNVGGFNATTRTFFVPVSDGAINILFTGTTSNATLAALEIKLSDLPFSQTTLTPAPTQAP